MLERLVAIVKTRLLPTGNTKDKAVRSSVWLFAMRGFGRGIHLIKLAVLARLLAPDDFGLMGIALLAMYAAEKFSRLGFDEALIQHPEENVDGYLDTVWLMKIARGATLGFVMYLSAPFLAEFFSEPRVRGLVQVLAVLPVLRGAFNPGMVYFRKDLNFHKRFAFDTAGNLVNFAAALTYAYFSPTVWALVVGNVLETIVKLALSYALHEYRPRLRFDSDKAREMFAYGKWLTASAGILFFLNQGDDAFVGWFLGASALGFYQMAFRFGNAPATELTIVLSNVLLSTFSKVKEDLEQLRSAFTQSVRLVSLVSFPASVGIIVVAPVFVPVALGDKWAPLVEELQILAAWGMIRSLSGVFSNLFKAIGRPDTDTKINAFRLTLLAAVIWPLTTRFGTEGTAVAVTLTAVASIIVQAYLAISEIRIPVRTLLVELAYPLGSALTMGAIVYWLRERLSVGAGPTELVVLVLVGALTYVVAMWTASRLTGYDVLTTLSSVATSFR